MIRGAIRNEPIRPHLSATNRHLFDIAVDRRFAGWTVLDDYGRPHVWKVWTARRPRSRERIAFLLRQTKDGRFRTGFTSGRGVADLRCHLKRSRAAADAIARRAVIEGKER